MGTVQEILKTIDLEMENKHILLVGLPESGKTTYIGALWNYINSIGNNKSIELFSLQNSESEYLDAIADKWTSCDDLDRNYRTTPISAIKMKVQIAASGEVISLEIPDLSGEVIGDMFEHREWSLEFDKLAQNMTGMIMFVSILNSNNKPTLLIHANEIENCLDTITANSDVKPVEYNPEFTCNQVKLVEMLQFINRERKDDDKTKIAIVVSAWDKAIELHGENYIPMQWVSSECPLLFQFLYSNDDLYEIDFFGISAQGGDYSKDKQELIKMDITKRIKVVNNGEISFDIAKPIVWLTKQK